MDMVKKISEAITRFEAKLNIKKIAKIMLIISVLGLITTVAVFLAKKNNEENEYNEIVAQVDGFVNQEEYDKALKKIELGTKKFKSNEEYISKLKDKRKAVHKIKEKSEYEECIEIANSENVNISDEDRIDAYTKAIDIKPLEEELYMSAASIFVQYNDYDKAVNLLSSGVDACEEFDDKEAKKTAIELTKRIDEINDLMFNDEYNTLYLEAKTAYEEGNFDKVLDNYNQCLLKNKNDGRLYALMGKAYFKKNKYTEAIQTLDTGINRLKSIGAYKKGSKQYSNYKQLIKLKKDYSKIQKVSDKYDMFFKELLSGCKKLKSDKNIDKVKNVILKNDFKTISGCNKVTYYTDKGMYVESFNSGMGIAVYNTGYIYYGEWKDGEKTGDGYYIAISKKEENVLIYYYQGTWNGDYPNGKGKIVYECFGEDELKFRTITEGSFVNGFEDGEMILKKKTKDSEYGELSMKYKCKNGQPIVIKENGKMKKSADGTFVIGYYYDKDKKKREIASIPAENDQPKKILWAVSGLGKNAN